MTLIIIYVIYFIKNENVVFQLSFWYRKNNNNLSESSIIYMNFIFFYLKRYFLILPEGRTALELQHSNITFFFIIFWLGKLWFVQFRSLLVFILENWYFKFTSKLSTVHPLSLLFGNKISSQFSLKQAPAVTGSK